MTHITINSTLAKQTFGGKKILLLTEKQPLQV
jgi:hypothetical protein